MDYLTFISTMTQHLAWPGALVGIAWAYRNDVKHLATRLVRGKVSNVEVEFAAFKSADAEVQRERIAFSFPSAAPAATTDTPAVLATTEPPATATAQHLQAIDLVFRRFQSDAGHPLMREVVAPGGMVFDGVMIRNRRISVLEVMAGDPPNLKERIRTRLAKLCEAIMLAAWEQPKLVVLFTFEDKFDDLAMETIANFRDWIRNEYGVSLVGTSYSLKALREQFGVATVGMPDVSLRQ